MANTLFITEFQRMSGDFPAGQMPPNAEQALTIQLGAAVLSAAFKTGTTFLRLVSDAGCSVAVGDNTVVATITQFFIPSGVPVYVGVKAGQFLSVIANS